ncbi:MAG: uroporphyrinogen decarboxylase/cobalamine-independent methonine synthase family protein [Anaerolineae bacterium]
MNMTLRSVRDWPRIRERYDAWWEGALLDRPIVQITAPRQPLEPDRPVDASDVYDWFTNPERVLRRIMRHVDATYYAGDAFPLAFPMSPGIPAIEAAYLGCPVHFVYESLTAWTDPIIKDWDHLPNLEVDPDNPWWRITQDLIERGARQGVGVYCTGIPDLQGGGQILAMLRGSQELAIDLLDRPEFILPVLETTNAAWLHYYQALFAIIHRYADGYYDWLGVWSSKPHVTVECDFCALISPRLFDRYFLPALAQQTEWIERTIYHLDGPGSLPHLESILALPRLDGIQWVPGAGATVMTDWIPLLQRIQAAGKKLTLSCGPGEVRRLLTELKPEGLLLSVGCANIQEADELEHQVCRMFGASQAVGSYRSGSVSSQTTYRKECAHDEHVAALYPGLERRPHRPLVPLRKRATSGQARLPEG